MTILSGAVVVVVLMYLANQTVTSRARLAPDGTVRFRYSPFLKVLGIAGGGLLVFAGARLSADLPAEPGSGDNTLLRGALFLGLMAVGVGGMFEFGLTEVAMTGEGLRGQVAWRREQFLRWEDIESVRYGSQTHALAIRSRDGRSIRAPLYLSGVGELYAELNRRLPPSAWGRRYPPLERKAGKEA